MSVNVIQKVEGGVDRTEHPPLCSSDGLGGGKYPDSYYLRYDPFEGDRDTDVKMQTVSLVKVRKERECWMGLSPDSKPHKIKVGQRARHERALVDGTWCAYYVCLPCIDSWLKDVCGEPPNDRISDPAKRRVD